MKNFGQSCFRIVQGGASPSFGIFGIGRCLAVLLDSVWSVLHSFRSVRTAQPSSWSTGQRLCTSQRPGSTPPVLGGRLFRVAAWWLHTLLMPALLLVFGVLWHTCMFCAVWSTTRLELGPHTLALMSSRRSSSAFRGLAHHVWLVVTFLDSHVLPRAGWVSGYMKFCQSCFRVVLKAVPRRLLVILE